MTSSLRHPDELESLSRSAEIEDVEATQDSTPDFAIVPSEDKAFGLSFAVFAGGSLKERGQDGMR